MYSQLEFLFNSFLIKINSKRPLWRLFVEFVLDMNLEASFLSFFVRFFPSFSFGAQGNSTKGLILNSCIAQLS